MKVYRFTALLQNEGWVSPAYVAIDEAGRITYLAELPPPHATAVETVEGLALPGFYNAHSHAFQYAMAGQAELHPTGITDDFWTWRESMYRCALHLSPDDLERTAAACYRQMIRHGYTHVAEFHYLHHHIDGKPYTNPAEMGERLLAAAATAGIRITLIPVFYQKGGFGMEPLPAQRRFICPTADAYLTLLEHTRRAVTCYEGASLGFGVHSLRAAEPQAAIEIIQAGPDQLPFHIHAAEQLKEVTDCQKFLKQRPVEWILNNLPVSSRFHLVHCTHLTEQEVQQLAQSEANVVLCPSTEANLGDGIFRLTEYLKAGGRFSVGSDSQVCLNPLEELRWLDYTQRLVTHRRNTFTDGGLTLMNITLAAGRRAMGIAATSFFAPGQPLDAAVFSLPPEKDFDKTTALAELLYASAGTLAGTLIGGRWQYRHPAVAV
jgi:formimidoylglutamate deiminase